jgi:FtsP/CotA-like multicopper oxidase with cupredoxin domain
MCPATSELLVQPRDIKVFWFFSSEKNSFPFYFVETTKMPPRKALWRLATLLTAVSLVSVRGRAGAEEFLGRICSISDPDEADPAASLATAAASTVTCQPQPSTYQPIGSVGSGGDTAVNLQVGYDPLTARLCFAANGLPDAPVLRVGVGHTLQIQVTNALVDTGAKNTTNCPIEVFGGEGQCGPRPVLPELPGANGSFYPMMANEAHAAHGESNLHVHGLFVSPKPCSDEVLRSTIYPVNWGGSVQTLPGCQTAPNTLTYTYALPAYHPAGLYWYHTHIHGVSEQETQMGLAGAIVVEDAGDAYRSSIGVTDEVLVVSDRPRPGLASPTRQSDRKAARQMARQSGSAAEPTLDPRIDQADQAGECATGASGRGAAGGTELWTLKLNGAAVPEFSAGFPPDNVLLSKTMQPGQRQIFRLVNASADSYMSPELVLSQDGVQTTLPLEVFARDGVGLADAQGNRHFTNFDVGTTPFILPPASRVEFVVHAPPAGAKLYLQSQAVHPGCGGNAYPARRLLLITPSGAPVDSGAADDSDLLVGEPSLSPYLATLSDTASVHRTFVLSEYTRDFTYGVTSWPLRTPTPSQYDPNATDFFITETASDDGEVDPHSIAVRPFIHGSSPQVVVHLHGGQSVTEEWLIENSTLEIHDFHTHQVHFRDITRRSANPDLQPFLDTLNVPAAPLVGDIATGRPGAPGWVKLRLTFTKADIGNTVFHCHILEHEDNGMMAKLRVVAD